MEEQFKLVSRVPDGGSVPAFLTPEHAEKVRSFHQTIPGYAPTPLVSLCDTARELGVGKIWVKDESKRFGLNAFKVLGGSYAIGNYLAGRLGRKLSETGYDVLTAPETRSSSPVRILRDESRQSRIRGLYPTGEGAGYAGGIVSAAADGLHAAEAVMRRFAPDNA